MSPSDRNFHRNGTIVERNVETLSPRLERRLCSRLSSLVQAKVSQRLLPRWFPLSVYSLRNYETISGGGREICSYKSFITVERRKGRERMIERERKTEREGAFSCLTLTYRKAVSHPDTSSNRAIYARGYRCTFWPRRDAESTRTYLYTYGEGCGTRVATC